MKKRIMSMVLLGAILLGCMTGCGDSKDISTTSNTTNGNSITSNESSNNVESNTITQETTTEASEDVGLGLADKHSEGDNTLIPKIKETHDDSVEFHIIRINGEEYDVTDMTGQDVHDIMGVEPDFRQKFVGTVEEDGFEHCFFKFGKSLNCYFEFLDENGKLYQNTTSTSRDYKEKKVQGLMFIDSDDSDFVTFAKSIRLGMEKEEVEAILGRGYTLPDGAIAYKTPSVTFIIGYKTQELSIEIDGKMEMTVITAIYIVSNK